MRRLGDIRSEKRGYTEKPGGEVWRKRQGNVPIKSRWKGFLSKVPASSPGEVSPGEVSFVLIFCFGEIDLTMGTFKLMYVSST